MKDFRRVARGILVLGCGLVGLGAIARTALNFAPGANLGLEGRGADHRAMGHFVNENLGEPWTLAPALAGEASGERLTLSIGDQPYTPNSEGLDDYHCFLIDPKLSRDAMVTGVKIDPDNAKIVHHTILFKLEGDAKREALEKNRASGGKGWTCFGGPNVGGPTTAAGGWLGAWVPGSGDGQMPSGVGVPLPKDALVVMQMHYNLANGSSPDRSSAEITLAPEGAKLRALRSQVLFAPIEVPCADGLTTPACQRETVIQQNSAKYGAAGSRLPNGLLLICQQRLEDYQKPVGDASRVDTSCERRAPNDATLFSVAGHMHLRGQDIKIELNPGTNAARTLLHIPHWDFHWQGNYWFRDPIEIKRGDVLKISCRFDNSSANQPILGDKMLSPRYVVWGEGTTDEMCLGVLMGSPKQN